MPMYRIIGLNKKTLGRVYGSTKGQAFQASVDQGLVTSRKKILSAVVEPYNDPYEQSYHDIYGVSKQKVCRTY